MRVAIYLADTGRIVRVVDCPEEMVELQTRAGEAWIEFLQGDDTTHFVVDAGVVNFPPCPEEHCTFDWGSRSWVDPRTLQDLKDARWAAIKDARAAAEFGGFTWDGSTFDSDAMSQSRIQGALQLATMAGAAFSIEWTLADNAARTLSAVDIEAVGVALGQRVALQHAKARGLRTEIENATTAAEISAVAW